MFELLTLVVFFWLLVKAAKLAFRLTWGIAKIIASILIVIALPLLVVCLLFVGGIALMVPLAVIGIAFAILKACL
ncbi:MAG: hypothetical protein J6B95_05010 [Oscillospiraceae bacterium]|nr:hypothetical protein [Oscillospiraceae bacterium]